jgi:hypothetical protein
MFGLRRLSKLGKSAGEARGDSSLGRADDRGDLAHAEAEDVVQDDRLSPLGRKGRDGVE